MSMRVPLDVGVVIVTIIVWIAFWQLAKLLTDEYDKKTKMWIFIVSIIVGIGLLYCCLLGFITRETEKHAGLKILFAAMTLISIMIASNFMLEVADDEGLSADFVSIFSINWFSVRANNKF